MHKFLQNHLLCAFVANLKIDLIYALYPESFCDKNLAIRKVFAFCDSSRSSLTPSRNIQHLLENSTKVSNVTLCQSACSGGQDWASRTGCEFEELSAGQIIWIGGMPPQTFIRSKFPQIEIELKDEKQIDSKYDIEVKPMSVQISFLIKLISLQVEFMNEIETWPMSQAQNI